MRVGAIHEISHPDEFWHWATNKVPSDGVVLQILLPNRDGSLALSVWDAASVTAVRRMIEHAVGPYSRNGFFEVNSENAIGL